MVKTKLIFNFLLKVYFLSLSLAAYASMEPTVTLITPDKGSELGGTNVSIYGSNFQLGADVDPYNSLPNLTFFLNFEDDYSDRQQQHPATVNNGPTFNSESLAGNSSVYFPGTPDSRLSVASDPSAFDSSEISLSFWVKGDGSWSGDGSDNGSANGNAVLFSSNDNIFVISVSPDDGRINLNIDQDSFIGARDIISDEKWHHLAFVLGKTGGSAIKVFVDGKLDINTTVSSSWSLANQSLLIGDGPNDFWEEFKGYIDEFAFISRGLSNEEVSSLFEFGLNPLGISVDIGGSYCLNVAVAAEDQLTCTTTQHLPGVNNVIIKNDLGLTTTVNGGFTYLVDNVTSLPPILSFLSPSSGTERGGTFLTIIGSGFKPNPTVTIGDINCLQVVFISSSQITCVTGVSGPGFFDVKVVNTDSQNSTLINGYNYIEFDFPAPTIDSISPNMGSESGNTLVQINGTGFRDGVLVSLGNANCVVQTVQDTVITCLTGANDFGIVDLELKNIDDKSAALSDAYEYTQDNPPPIPTIILINRSSGNISGGEALTILGVGFYAGSEVYIGTSKCEITTLIDANLDEITCTTPAHAKGLVKVIIRNDREKFSNTIDFEYIDPNYQLPTPVAPAPPPVLPPLAEKEQENGFEAKSQKKNVAPISGPLQNCGEASTAIPSASYLLYFLNYLIGLGVSMIFKIRKSKRPQRRGRDI